MFSEKALTKENLIAFLKEKGLYNECGEWCMPLYLKQEKSLHWQVLPIGSFILMVC